MTDLQISNNLKINANTLIVIIYNKLTKIIHYKPMIINVYAARQANIIMDLIRRYYDLSNSIVSNTSVLFI